MNLGEFSSDISSSGGADILAARAYYSGLALGLEDRFKHTFYNAVDELLRFPEKNAVKIVPEIRTRLRRPFPYLIFYVVKEEVVFVLAVQYAGRKPDRLRGIISQRDSSP